MTETTKDVQHWLALLAEANAAIGAARDALTQARSVTAVRAASEDIEFWTARKAFCAAALVADKTCLGCTAPLRAGDPDLCSLCDLHAPLSSYGADR